LYNIGDEVKDRLYIVIVGKMSLIYRLDKRNMGKKLGQVTAGDTFGEEGYFS
jgi:CRP-like cAMP-binding protein